MQQFNHFNQSNQYSEQTRLENKWDHSSGLRNYSHWCLRDVHQLSSHIKNNEGTALVWWFLLAVACQCFLCCKTVEFSIWVGTERLMQTKNGAKLRDKVLDLSVINGLMLSKKKILSKLFSSVTRLSLRDRLISTSGKTSESRCCSSMSKGASSGEVLESPFGCASLQA